MTLHKVWGIRSIWGMSMNEKKSKISTENSWRSASRSEIGYSQASRHENAPMAPGNSWREEQLQKQSDEREYGNSNCTRKSVLGESKTDDQDLSAPAKEVGNVSRILNFLDASIHKCVDMENVHVFVDESSHPSWAEYLTNSEDLQEHELRRH